MKSILGLSVITLALALVSLRPVYTLDKFNSLDDITSAIRLGNAGQLSRYLDSRVDIYLPDKSDSYSKIQAVMIIRDFFSTNGVRNFVVRKMGFSGQSEYCVGVLQTSNGDYRTTLFTRLKGDRQLVQELRFQAN